MEVISRKEAIQLGLTRYFTGIPCKRGHICERVMDGRCIECKRFSQIDLSGKDGRNHIRRIWKKAGNPYTPELYDINYEIQNGCCAICGKFQIRLCGDHSHIIKNLPRGLLCHRCNLAIGRIEDHPLYIGRAIRFCEKPDTNIKYSKSARGRNGIKKYHMPFAIYWRNIEQELLEDQNWMCPITLETCPVHWEIDHNHKTNMVRGVLSPKGNAFIGLFDDDVELMKKSKEYIELWIKNAF